MGWVIFVLAPFVGKGQAQIAPIVAGPLYTDRDIVDRAMRPGSEDNMRAIATLIARHLASGNW
jgi:hypothetical protein